MDTDHDGYVSQDELKAWLKKVEQRYIIQDVERTFDEYKEEFKTDFVTFEQHKSKISEDYDDDEDPEGE